MSRGLMLAACLLGATACGATSAQTAWVGPSPMEPLELFEATEAALVDRGYRVTTRDLRTGRLVVEARAGRGYSFHIWCYADRWLRIVPVGPGVQRDTSWRLPEHLRREYYTLAELLQTRTVRAR